MNRRNFVRHGIAGGIGLAAVNRVAAKEISTDSNAPVNAPPPAAFELDELTVGELQAGMASGKYTAHSLAKKYLDRIDEIDKHGPAINSVIELNPDVLSIASDLARGYQTDGGIDQPRRHHSHLAQSGHGRADVPHGDRCCNFAGRNCGRRFTRHVFTAFWWITSS